MNIEKKIIDYYEDEYIHFAKLLSEKPAWLNPGEAFHNATQRCLGVANLAQTCGVEYSFIEAVFNDYKERMWNLMMEVGE